MKSLTKTTIIILMLLQLIPILAATTTKQDKNRKTVVMIIPDPLAPKNAVPIEGNEVNTAYNEITAVLLSQGITVIDKAFVDEALGEIRRNQDIDMDAASIQYGKKNMADKVLWFYVVDKSANYQDFRFETRIKLISVRTAQVVLSIQKEGIDKETREAAIQQSVSNTLKDAIPQIASSSEMFTVTFKGRIRLEVQNELDNIFNDIAEVDSYDGYVVNENAYEYRVSTSCSVGLLRNAIHEEIKKRRIDVELENQTVNSLAFKMLPRKTIHSSLAWVSGIATLASAGTAGFFYWKAEDSFDKYTKATTASQCKAYKQDTEDYDNKTMISGIATGVLGTWFIYEVSRVSKLKKVAAISVYNPNPKTYGINVSARF